MGCFRSKTPHIWWAWTNFIRTKIIKVFLFIFGIIVGRWRIFGVIVRDFYFILIQDNLFNEGENQKLRSVFDYLG